MASTCWAVGLGAFRLRSCRCTTFLAGVTPWTLRQDNEQHDDDRRDDRRGERATQGKAAVGDWLINKVPHCCAQRPRQDECDPKQRDTRYPGPVIEGDDRAESCGESQRAAFVTESRVSASQSPSAVPRVWENVIVAQ